MQVYHGSVLGGPVLQHLNFTEEGIVVDSTLGDGGHTELLLKNSGPGLNVLGIDRDADALTRASKRLAPYGGRVRFAHGNYSEIKSILARFGIPKIDGLLLDLGVSSPQIDTPERGFSFMKAGPLDMRMDQREALTAADLLKTLSDRDLEFLFREYGEERHARRIVRAIRRAQAEAPIATTTELSAIISRAVPGSRQARIHPATRVFQALRIAVNRELDHLKTALADSLDVLSEGARVIVISFHSLEDRIVKNFFRDEEKGCVSPPRLPVCVCGKKPRLKVITRRVITPTEEEIAANPRASSAKMRVAERIYV
jgi:16S rRNA (cytosine1402-N4)-methyltransferase